MTPKALIVAALSLLFSLNTFAFDISKDDPKCTMTQGQDKYETPTRIGQKSELFANDCIDTNRFRPPKVLKNNDKFLIFANYRHEDQYWKATLSKKAKIEKVFFHIVRFDVVSGVTAAHTQFRVRLAKGSELILEPQTGEENAALESKKVRDIVVSYEAARPENKAYNFALGAVDNYLLVTRVLSGKQRLFEGRSNKTEQYELGISAQNNNGDDERMLMLVEAITNGSKKKFNEFYNTLKPNCTTEVFDLIDELPSRKSRGDEPFLTMISNDPVAGPSLKGLADRGLNPKFTAYLSSEVLFGNEYEDFEPASTPSLNLLSNIDGFPYSIIIASEDDAKNSEVTIAGKQIAYELAPKLAQRLGSTLMLSGEMSTSSIFTSLKSLAPVVQEQLKDINGRLSEKPINISVYLSPWNQTGTPVDAMKKLGVKARLPFESFETTYKKARKMNQGLARVALDKADQGGAFGLMSVGIHLNLVKDKSTASLQVLGHLGPLTEIFPEPQKSEAADVLGIVIPRHATQDAMFQPMTLLDLTVKYSSDEKKQEVPSLNMQFGPYNGFYSSTGDNTVRGKFSVDPGSCSMQSFATPYLKAEVHKFGLTLNARMPITRLDFDLEKQVASNADVNVKTLLGIVCLDNQEQASSEVLKAINKELSGLNEKAQDKGVDFGVQFLEKLLSNNEEGKVPGIEINQ